MNTVPTPSPDATEQALRSAGFHALADPTRQSILQLLVSERLHVDELASHFPISRPAVSKHLRTLKEAGLVKETLEGRRAYYRVNLAQLRQLENWLSTQCRQWEASLSRLKRLVEGDG